MKDIGTQTIETERFILRRVTLDDAQTMFDFCSNEDVAKYMNWPAHKDISVTKKVISDWLNNYSKEDFYQWAIEDKSSKQMIGLISYHDINKRIESASIGYCLSKKFWNKGVMTEVALAGNNFMLTKAGYNRIEGYHDVENPPSGKVMQKCNMRFEGLRRNGGKYDDGRFCNVNVYSIIKSDLK
ncbi:GNAT family N-acetyltransferase [Endomicrobium proavitum]|uniref:N-acetyltransferase n=1 Tax=Endomicrobium proavitum TaxID=1408281 RepID=A0A0G3WHM4_9BACT|nr:GNAT family N-acetyltransferase [Endomicrobium proavitum]AKL97833.1 N-acetyltransferase [Endomicrobium proavitum]